MKVVESGHKYLLDSIDGELLQMLTFIRRDGGGPSHPGTQTQDVLRVLIDRTQYCDRCLRWDGNDQIIHHLRMALALHESRALVRKAEKGLYDPERVLIGSDGHFLLRYM